METVLFWIAWGLISYWALKTFYFSFDKNKLQKLRLTSLGINLSVLVLFFLPWLPRLQGGFSGWEIIGQGNVFVALLFIVIVSSILLFLTNSHTFFKVGVGLHIATSIVFIMIMIRLMPGTFTLTLQSVAPIIASLMLLAGNAVVLLLWQQVQLMEKKGIKNN